MNLKKDNKFKNIQLPYEKCITNGASSLTDKELISVILRCGTSKINVIDLADSIISRFCPSGRLGALYNTSFEELKNVEGIGNVKAAQILCMFELAKRISKEPFNCTGSFDCPEKAAGYFMQEMRLCETENVYLILLDSKNSLIKRIILSKGSVSSSVLEPREVFMYALRNNAVGVMLMHNHPSGNPTPSKEDILVTKRIEQAGSIIGINLIDHIIIGDNTFVSLKQKGFI